MPPRVHATSTQRLLGLRALKVGTWGGGGHVRENEDAPSDTLKQQERRAKGHGEKQKSQP